MDQPTTREPIPAEPETVVFGDLKDFVASCGSGSFVVVTEPRVLSLFGEAFSNCSTALVPEGENAKTIKSLEALYLKFAELGLDRHSSVLSIGGGSVSDLAGFAAHTWMRGIDFLAAPTTLLAMTDAALGGKNGIDFGGLKNLIGSFQLPKKVFCDVKTLYSLDSTQFASGMAEVIKHAILSGERDFEFLESIPGDFLSSDQRAIDETTLIKLVGDSQKVKLAVVAQDFKESGARKLLNLGHTVGHAVESLTGLPHGHCVALGTVAACGISMKLGLMRPDVAARIAELFKKFALPTSLSSLGSGVLSAVPGKIAGDKKRFAEKIDLVLPISLGRVQVVSVNIGQIPELLGGAA